MKFKFLLLNLLLLMFFACSKDDDNVGKNSVEKEFVSSPLPSKEEKSDKDENNGEEEDVVLSLKFPSQTNSMAQKQTKTASKVLKDEEELYQVEYNTSEFLYVKLKNEEEAVLVSYQSNSHSKNAISKFLFPNYVSCDNKWYKVTEIGDNEHPIFGSFVPFDELEIPETIQKINTNSLTEVAVVVFNAATKVSEDVLEKIIEIVVEAEEFKEEFEKINEVELDKNENQGSLEVQEEEKDYVDFGEGFSVYWKKMNYGAKSETEAGEFVGYQIANEINVDGWRAPTQEEVEELVTKATWTKQVDGINNNYLVSVGDVSIFFPATEIKKFDSSGALVAESGYTNNFVKLWTSTQYPNMNNNYCIYCVNKTTVGTVSWERYIPVRLVKDKAKSK